MKIIQASKVEILITVLDYSSIEDEKNNIIVKIDTWRGKEVACARECS
jgi:hypothetical protein